MGGIDLRQLDPILVRQKIGYVPQRINIFSGSIRENILMGRKGVSDTDLIDILKQSGLSELLSCHQQGLDFEVGEEGRHLSGGQIQSLALARALVGQPEILLLDEPTSSMDSYAEGCFKKLIAELNHVTVVLVTHKANLLEAVDRVVVLEKGCLIADHSSGNLRQQAAQKQQLTVEVV